MKNLNFKKQIKSVFIIASIVLSIFMLTAFSAYAWEHPTVNTIETELYPDQSKTYSSSKKGPNMYYEGSNFSVYDRYVYFDMQYNEDDRWITVERCNKRLPKGGTIEKTLTPSVSSNAYWRQVLTCKHVNQGGKGVGWMW